MPDYPLAEEHFVPRSYMFDSNACKVLVIHKTGGDATPAAILQTFLTNPDRPSVHYGVGTDGSIWQYVPEALGAGGNCCVEPGYDPFWAQFNPMAVGSSSGTNLNTVTLSLEHCDAALDNSTPLTPTQQDASFKLIAYLVAKYSIPLSHIKGHNTIDPQSRARCPGNYPWPALFAYLQNGGNMAGVPIGWQYDQATQTLTDPNGGKVGPPYSAHVLASNWDPHNFLWIAAYHTNQLEAANPGLGAGTQIIFYESMLCVPDNPPDPNLANLKGKVVTEYVGIEAAYARSQWTRYSGIAQQFQTQFTEEQTKNTALTAQVAQLEAQIAALSQPTADAQAIVQIKQIVAAL